MRKFIKENNLEGEVKKMGCSNVSEHYMEEAQEMINVIEHISSNIRKTWPDKLKDLRVKKFGEVVLDKDELPLLDGGDIWHLVVISWLVGALALSSSRL